MNHELDEYELEKIFSDYNKIIENAENGGYAKQSKLGSLFEAHLNSLVGAPPAMYANFLLLKYFFPESPTEEFVAMWAIITWPVFFYLSVGRIYLFRRIFEKWGIDLEPKSLYRRFKNRLK